ncbi:hypothetical protein CFO_g2276 [Ceratocystis platani]|uniref:Uncharacterized protein n=2 Tax=Ceratocystis TaxID=5157 RepID=A0A0F8B4S0_CERFI|nr:hypothetical protein CFO_g2276 [Ceratocystis platani]
MAPTASRAKKATKKSKKPAMSLQTLIETAYAKLKLGDIEEAEQTVSSALQLAKGNPDSELLCLNLMGQICIEAGEPDRAREYFMQAVSLDPEGDKPEATGGGPEKFSWLAQLSEIGGKDSVQWYERAARALRAQIQALSDKVSTSAAPLNTESEVAVLEKQRALATVLCSVVEVYMTDLSWEADAEQRCEALITEASLTCPNSPEMWQTVANVRISQERDDDARAALKRSLELWAELPSNDPAVPEFAERISLAKLLLEVTLMDEARFVLDRLVKDDDHSIEAWYLGGWHRFLVGEVAAGEGRSEEHVSMWQAARRRLSQCLHLYQTLDYEDERLHDHAVELLGQIQEKLGEPTTDDDETDVEGVDEEDDGEDEEMEG